MFVSVELRCYLYKKTSVAKSIEIPVVVISETDLLEKLVVDKQVKFQLPVYILCLQGLQRDF